MSAASSSTIIRSTWYLAGSAIAAAMSIGAASIVNAEPVWDVGDYDSCIRSAPADTKNGSVEGWIEYTRFCCYRSGGEWVSDDFGGKCVAPAATEGKPLPPTTGPFIPPAGGVADEPPPPPPRKPAPPRPTFAGTA
jgi:hypothetical protein